MKTTRAAKPRRLKKKKKKVKKLMKRAGLEMPVRFSKPTQQLD